MRHLRRALSAHPAIAQLRVSQPIATPGAFRLTEAGMAILRDAGFGPAEAAAQFRTLFIYTFGVAIFNPPAREAQAQRSVGAALATLSRDEYPALSEAIPELVASLEPEAQFERGLALILDGIEARHVALPA
jgi:hypothetical protein